MGILNSFFLMGRFKSRLSKKSSNCFSKTSIMCIKVVLHLLLVSQLVMVLLDSYSLVMKVLDSQLIYEVMLITAHPSGSWT